MTDVLRCIIIPTLSIKWLVPYSAVAEVVAFEPPLPVSNAPPWFLGNLEWHDKSIPLISLDKLINPSQGEEKKSLHIAIFNRISDNGLDFLGIALPALPKMLRIKRGELKAYSQKTEPYLLAEASLNNEIVSIPDLQWIEEKAAQSQISPPHLQD